MGEGEAGARGGGGVVGCFEKRVGFGGGGGWWGGGGGVSLPRMH